MLLCNVELRMNDINTKCAYYYYQFNIIVLLVSYFTSD